MNAINKLKSKVKDLQNYVLENTNLEVEIQSSQYPMKISFYEAQIGMLSEDVSDGTPSLCFVFYDEMQIITVDGFKLNETVFNKLKNISKEINRLYLHSFREKIDELIVPLWDCIDNTAQVALYHKKRFDGIMKLKTS